MLAHIFCIKTKIKNPTEGYLYVGNFVYPYIVIKAPNLGEAEAFLNKYSYSTSELIYIDSFEIDDKRNNKNLYNEAILKYFINNITINLIILNETIENAWKETEKYPTLLKYSEKLSGEENVDLELSEQAQMHSAMSKLFYDLEAVESSLNDIDYKISRLNTLIRNNDNFRHYLVHLEQLKTKLEFLRNEFNKVDNKVFTLIRVKKREIEILTSMLTQRKLSDIRNINNNQYKMLIQSAEESAKGEVLEIALVWLTLLIVYSIFSDIIDSYFVLHGFNLILSKIFISVLLFCLTLMLVKVGDIFVKMERSKLKEEKRFV